MNFIEKIYIKYLIKKNFKKEFVDSGLVEKDFKVFWDSERQDFGIHYREIKREVVESNYEEVTEDE